MGDGDTGYVDLARGQEVLAFFCCHDGPEGSRYIRVAEGRAGAAPLVGLSAGWSTASVERDFHAAAFVEGDRETHVSLRFRGSFADPALGARQELPALVHPRLVRDVVGAAPPPLLSVFCVRWLGSTGGPARSDWDVAGDGVVREALDGLARAMPGEYEVHTAWVKGEDLGAISGEEVRRMLRGQHATAWYFLWPSRGSRRPGCCPDAELNALVQRVERAGVPTGWPHPGHVWRLLVARSWMAQMCLLPAYRVPVGTCVHYAEFAEDPAREAERALLTLLDLRLRTRDAPAERSGFQGVVRLGLEGAGGRILRFEGVDGLASALRALFTAPSSEQLTCVAQELPQDALCACCVVCVREGADGVARWRRWSGPPSAPSPDAAPGIVWEALSSRDFLGDDGDGAAVVAAHFGGDEAAYQEGVRRLDALVDHWLLWYSTECPEPPQALTFEFVLARTPDDASGKALGACPHAVDVWTWDIHECGAPLCGVPAAVRAAATVMSAMRNDESGRFPLPLPCSPSSADRE